METVERDYSPKGVKFYYIYKALAHPETNSYVAPFTQEERLMHVKEAERVIGSRINWLCDTIDNDVKHALGNAPNSEYIIDPDGKVVVRRQWCQPNDTRRDLERFVGRVENPTRVEDIDVRFTPPAPGAPSGLVPRVQTPSGLSALRLEAIRGEDKEPFYVKLRAEADANVLRGRAGKLYLGFHVDPLYDVHWNNLAEPVRYSLQIEGGEIKPATGEGPKVEHPADIDPREFLVDVERWPAGKPLRLRVDYFACSDKEGWCKPVSQEYLIHATRDADGGNARRSGSRRRPGIAGGPPGFGGGRPGFGGGPPRPGFGGAVDNGPRRAGGLGGNRLMVQVVSYDAETKTLTVRDRSRKQTKFQVTDSTKVRIGRDRREGSVDKLKRGAVIMLMSEPAKEGETPAIRGIMLR